MGIHVQINPTRDGRFRAIGLHEHQGEVAFGDTREQAFYNLVVYEMTSRIYVLDNAASREVVDPEPAKTP